MRVLDLFSGIGGFSLGLHRVHPDFETVAFCEQDQACQKVLKKHWPDVPIYEDVRTLTYEKLKEDGLLAHPKCPRGKSGELHTENFTQASQRRQTDSPISTGQGRGTISVDTGEQAIDLICGGFPCQPFSHAGKRKGEEDDRHLWPEYFRLIQEIRPRWVFGENVAGLINMGLDQVLSDLESEDYSCQTIIIPACALNAPHRRDRVWIIANSKGIGYGRGNSEECRIDKRIFQPKECKGSEVGGEIEGCGGKSTLANAIGRGWRDTQNPEIFGRRISNSFINSSKTMADTQGFGIQRGGTAREQEPEAHGRSGLSLCNSPEGIGGFWTIEPELGRMANGIPHRVDRLKQLGNAVVPQIVEIIGKAIMEADSEVA